jgi:hypothetical protein
LFFGALSAHGFREFPRQKLNVSYVMKVVALLIAAAGGAQTSFQSNHEELS